MKKVVLGLAVLSVSVSLAGAALLLNDAFSYSDGSLVTAAGSPWTTYSGTSGQIKVEGDIVVAVPARDVLLVTGSQSREGLKAVRAAVADVMKGGYALTDTLFVYRGGKFVRFGTR